MKILLIDNYDSFTYNLVHYLEGLDCEVRVQFNDQIDKGLYQWADALVLSPGPGLPSGAHELLSAIAENYLQKPVLGVCLGMQALAHFFGDELYNLSAVKHGVQNTIQIDPTCPLYKNLPPEIKVGLYHSWAVKLKENSPFVPTAYNAEGVLMSMRHKNLALFGVQYHPESILTDYGKDLIANFLNYVKENYEL